MTRDELSALINEAVHSVMHSKPNATEPKAHIKGIHKLAEFLQISPGRAQKLKSDGVLPYFQDGRLVLFDQDKVRDAMAAHNKKKLK